jgi:hypothetical protein
MQSVKSAAAAKYNFYQRGGDESDVGEYAVKLLEVGHSSRSLATTNWTALRYTGARLNATVAGQDISS